MVAAAQDGDARAYDALLYDRLPLLRAIGCRRLREAAWLEDAEKIVGSRNRTSCSLVSAVIW